MTRTISRSRRNVLVGQSEGAVFSDSVHEDAVASTECVPKSASRPPSQCRNRRGRRKRQTHMSAMYNSLPSGLKSAE